MFTNMSEMFNLPKNFNGDISNWDTSQVTTMFKMFHDASNFNGDISNWDTHVMYMNSMFYYAESFERNIRNWNVNPNVSGMFYMVTSFLNTFGDLINGDGTPKDQIPIFLTNQLLNCLVNILQSPLMKLLNKL